MTEAKTRFDDHLSVGCNCLKNFDAIGDEFALRHIWIASISAFDLYMTELVSEVGLRWIDRSPPILTESLQQVKIPLLSILEMEGMSPTERLLFYRNHVYSAVQYTSFYKPSGVSEALGYIWICPGKEKWARITARMKATGRYVHVVEEDIRAELELIGNRRDLIAHSADTPPGSRSSNPVDRQDAVQILQFIGDLAEAIDLETETQLTQ